MFSEQEIQFLAERASVFSGKNLHIHIIANPVAGGFTIRSRQLANRAALDSALSAASAKPVVVRSCDSTIYYTAAAGHAAGLTAEILDKAAKDSGSDSLYCIITAGGDGTSYDVQSVFARLVLEQSFRHLISKVCFIRLPFGTGNDGSDGRTLEESLSLLVEASRFEKQCAVRVASAGSSKPCWYSFNIASIGLDAFVTHMTNKLKHRFPGDSYKVWLDIACLFYNRIYTVEPMRISLFDRNNSEIAILNEKLLLFLMGASGKRTYGSNQKILPDERNVCGMTEMPLGKKLFLKKHVRTGTHASFPEALLFSAEKALIEYGSTILLQLDGESHELAGSDFPLVMERTEPFITVIKRK